MSKTSRREFFRLAGIAGVGFAIGGTLLSRVVSAQTSQPIAKTKNLFPFHLDRTLYLNQDQPEAGLAFKNKAGEPWISVSDVSFSSTKPGDVTGKMTYLPLYPAGVVAVVALTFFDAKGELMGRVAVKCPSESGKTERTYPVYVEKVVGFHVQLPADRPVTEFGVLLAQDSQQ